MSELFTKSQNTLLGSCLEFLTKAPLVADQIQFEYMIIDFVGIGVETTKRKNCIVSTVCDRSIDQTTRSADIRTEVSDFETLNSPDRWVRHEKSVIWQCRRARGQRGTIRGLKTTASIRIRCKSKDRSHASSSRGRWLRLSHSVRGLDVHQMSGTLDSIRGDYVFRGVGHEALQSWRNWVKKSLCQSGLNDAWHCSDFLELFSKDKKDRGWILIE